MELASHLNKNINREIQIKRVLALEFVLAAWSCLFFTFPIQCQPSMVQPQAEMLTNASDILSLTTERASEGLAVNLKAVVTVAEPDWNGFYIQDSTGGIFVNNLNDKYPQPGDYIEISGVSGVGPFAPIIIEPHWKKVGTEPLPEAKQVTVEELMAGIEACQRVEISGIVHAAQIESGRLLIDLTSGGNHLHVIAKAPPGTDPQSLIAAKVRVRGTAVTKYNASLRQLISVSVYVPDAADFIVEQYELKNPFKEPVIPLNSIAQYRRDNYPGKRVHIKGTVTCQRPGADLFLEDDSGGLQVMTGQPGIFAPGDVVEAVGFPEVENSLPILKDAFVKKAGEHNAEIKPQAATVRGILAGLHHGDFITVQGKVINRIVNQIQARANEPSRAESVFVLQNSNSIFAAKLMLPQKDSEPVSIPIGSVVKVSGVCLTEMGDDGKIASFQLLLPAAQDIRVVQKPSWFTPKHLLYCGAAGLFVLTVISTLTVTFAKKNSILRRLIREKESAQAELQQAHDLLEQRVIERTAELKFQITARKESEVQFKAILGERTRLAQELHDTLEQTLTGIALQLDTAAMLSKKNPNGATQPLELARDLMRQSQVELRRSVWDLRCRALEQFDLAGALQSSSRQITQGTNIQVEFETKGTVRTLPEFVEENLLRISQEALTNVIKHAQATRVKIELEFGSQTVILQTADNGKGFNPENCFGSQNGHFGLVGMVERAKRLGGQVHITSTPESGTTVRVEIPNEPNQEPQNIEIPETQI